MQARRLAPPLALLLLLALFLALFLAFTVDGGAPPTPVSEEVREWRPIVERWELRAPREGLPGRVCGHLDLCIDPATRLTEFGERCTWTARVWLASSSQPVVLRDVHILGYAVFWTHTDQDPLTFDQPWRGGLWWRFEHEKVDVAIPAPCDANAAKVNFNISARGPLGYPHHGAQGIEVQL